MSNSDKISEKKYKKLKESEEKFRMISSNAQDAIIQMNEHGLIVYWNKSAEKLFGYSENKVLGKNLHLLITPKRYLKRFNEAFANFRNSGQGAAIDKTLELEGRRINGEEFPIELSLSSYQVNGEWNAVGIIRDITERKRKEEVIRFQRDIIENMSEGVYLIKLDDGTIVYNNPAFEEMFGYNPGEMIGKDVAIVNAPTDKTPEETREVIMGIIKETGEWRGEVLNIKKDGTPFWCYANVSLFDHPEHGTVIISVHTDITKRKKAELKLKVSEENYRLITENTNDIIAVLDDKFRLEYISEAPLNKMLGYKSVDYIGKSDFLVIHPDDRKMVINGLIKGSETGEVISDARLRHKDGHYIWVESRGKTFIDRNGEKKNILNLRNITERKKVELEIVNLAKFPSENPNPILRMAREKVIYANKEGEKIFTSSEGSEVPAVLQESLVKALDTNKTISTEITLNSRVFSLDITPISEEEYANVYGRDITERKNAEVQLKSTMEDVKRSNTELEQFAYIASHDLQEPLRMISSFVQLLAKRYKDRLDEDADDFINFIVDGAKRMQIMINDLLTYSRIGRIDKEFRSIDSNIVLTNVLEMLGLSIKDTNATITYDSLPKILANEGELTQMFQNLISNAIKFHKEEEPPVVHISAKLQKTQWIFSVRDNGIGLDSQNFDRIFIIFQRLHTKDEFSGTGLGLAICKKIIERHGGEIWVESEVGKGSTFYFSIPKTKV